MSAEIIKFPRTRREMIQAMISTASRLESVSPKECIRLQNEVIVMLIMECNRSTRVAKAALKVVSRGD